MLFADCSGEVHTYYMVFCTDLIMFSSRTSAMKLITEVVATLLLRVIRMCISRSLGTFTETHWTFTEMFKVLCEFLLKESLIYLLRKLACMLHSVTGGEFFKNIPYAFRHTKRFIEPTSVMVL